MLDIIILFLVGRAIYRKVTEKNWPGWPFVLIYIPLVVGFALAGAIIAAVATGAFDANGNADQLSLMLGAVAGEICAAVLCYLAVLALPDRSEPDDDDDESDDRPSRSARRSYRDEEADDDAESRRLPKARRADDEEDENDWRRR